MKNQVTVEFITVSPLGDIFTALSMLNPDNLNVKINTVVGNGNGGRRTTRGGNGVKRGRPLHYKDDRIVWNKEEGNINIAASLARMNTSRDILMNTRTRVGTTEYAVKQGMLRQDRQF